MSALLQPIGVILPALYFFTAVLYGMAFGGERSPRLFERRRPVFRVVLLLHGLWLLAHARAAGSLPVGNTWMLVSAISWTTALLFGGITWRQSQATVGFFVIALCSLLQLFASAFGPLAPIATAPADTFRILHSVTSILASAALLLSGIYGFLHILLYRQMRQRTFGPIFRALPNLELLAGMMRRAALAGFVFLTIGLNLGIIMGHARSNDGFDYGDPHVILTLALWVHFGAISFSRYIRGLTARRASYAAFAGLVSLLLLIVLTLLPSVTAHAL